MLYFAYGSNLSLRRLAARIDSARREQPASLPGYSLRFHKRSHDGSAKCDAFHTGKRTDHVHGLIYRIGRQDRQHLDRIEGLGAGYEARTVTLACETGGEVSAFTYCATHIDDSLKPYAWYLEHVLTGAREAGLPDDYIARLSATESVADHDLDRDRAERAIYR